MTSFLQVIKSAIFGESSSKMIMINESCLELSIQFYLDLLIYLIYYRKSRTLCTYQGLGTFLSLITSDLMSKTSCLVWTLWLQLCKQPVLVFSPSATVMCRWVLCYLQIEEFLLTSLWWHKYEVYFRKSNVWVCLSVHKAEGVPLFQVQGVLISPGMGISHNPDL